MAGGVLKLDRVALLGPARGEERLACPNDVAGDALAERERATCQLRTGLHLPHDLDHLAAHVVQAQIEARRVERARGSPVEHAEKIDRIQRRIRDLLQVGVQAVVTRGGRNTIHRTAENAGRPRASAEY